MEWQAVLQLISRIVQLLVGICYFYQLVYLFLPFLCRPRPHKQEKLHRYGVLIAARNEEEVLPQLLWSITRQDYPASLITTYVVADNCTDATAQVAAQYGAVVLERFDTQRVGKGYALHDLLDWISQRSEYGQLDAFLVFDADNLLQPDYIRQMNQVCSDGYDAFCGYRNSKNFGDSWVSAGHSVWFLHDCVHVSRSRALTGLPCTVTGTGFGFTRQLLETMGGWNFFTLTEDIQFSFWCATRGIRVGYCHDAILFDEQPVTMHQSFRQRIRWVQGTIQVSLRYGPDLIRGLFRGPRTCRACMQCLTLSMWGAVVSGLAGLFGFVTTWLTQGAQAAALSALLGLGGFVAFLLLAGLLTLLTEKSRLPVPARKRWLGLVAFPLYVLSYVPITCAALFKKRRWKPIRHTAVRAEDLIS